MELRTVVSLQQHCILYVISHVHEFSPHELALLPRYIRHGLLRQIPTLHLFHLEQTSVAEGINTLQIWREMTNRLPNVVITSPFSNTITNLQDHRTFRDQYITSVWDAVLNGQPSQLLHLLQEVFKIHMSTFPVTVNAIQHWTWFVPIADTYIVPRETPVNLRSELATYLMNIGAFPRVLDIQSIDVLEELWRCKKHETLQQLLSRSKMRTLCVKFDTDARRESESFVLHAVLRRSQPLLHTLKLWDISGSLLLSILSNAEGHTSLKELDVRLHQQTSFCHGIGSALALVISNQIALEKIMLEHVGTAFPSGPDGELLVSVLSNLLIQPQFCNLTIGGFCNVPLEGVKSLTEAFVSCSSVQNQNLFFSCLHIAQEEEDPSQGRRERTTSITVVQKSQASRRSQILAYQQPHIQASQTSPQKHIKFSCTNVPLTFLEWFSNLECVHLNSLELSFCNLDAGMVTDLFNGHPLFVVRSGTHFPYL